MYRVWIDRLALAVHTDHEGHGAGDQSVARHHGEIVSIWYLAGGMEEAEADHAGSNRRSPSSRAHRGDWISKPSSGPGSCGNSWAHLDPGSMTWISKPSSGPGSDS